MRGLLVPEIKLNKMKIRYHDNKGRERWAAAGEIVPAGSFINNGQTRLDKNHIIAIGIEEGNPYDQCNKQTRYLYFKQIN